MFAVDFGEGTAAVVDLSGLRGAAGRGGISFGDTGGARWRWCAWWGMRRA